MAITKKKKTTDDESGWEPIPDRIGRGILMEVQGVEGEGKSSFAMTAPGKIAYLDIDQSVDRARKPDDPDKVRVHRVRYQIDIGMAKEAIRDLCSKVWNDAETKARKAAATWANSVVIDTGTEAWELRRMADFGELNPKGRRMDRVYGPINAAYRQFHRAIYRDARKHLIIVSQMFDEYRDSLNSQGEQVSTRTGKKVPKGFKEISYLADVSVRAFKEAGEFKVEVVRCKLGPLGPSIEGSVLEGEQATFAGVVSLATGTEMGEWE